MSPSAEESAVPSQPQKLSVEESHAFQLLRLPPGSWSALFAVPFVRMLWGVTTDGTARMKVMYAREESYTTALRDFCQQPQFRGRGPEAMFNYDAAGDFLRWLLPVDPHRPPQREAFSLGMALLGWHLAKDYSWEETLKVLTHLENFRHRAYFEHIPLPVIESNLERVRERADEYLPCTRFDYNPQPEPLPEPTWTEMQPFLGRYAWACLLLDPVGRRLRDHFGSNERLHGLFADLLLEEARKSTPLGEALAPPWLRVLKQRHVTRIDRGEAQARELLVRGLATVPFLERELMLDDLARTLPKVEERPPLGRRRSVYGESEFRRDFGDLRFQIARYRSRPRFSPVETPRPTRERPGSTPQPKEIERGREGIPGSSLVPKPEPARPEPRPEPKPAPPRVNVYTADPFVEVSWVKAVEAARSFSVADAESVLTQKLLFDDCRADGQMVVVVRKEEAVPKTLWFVGDLHADLLCLANAWDYIQARAETEKQKPHVVFLGDFVDRGKHDHETLLYLFRLLQENPGRIAVLPGNHDEDISYDESTGVFRSGVSPAEYVDWLNKQVAAAGADSSAAEAVRLGQAFVRFLRNRPRAIFLPDGTFLSHGGMPHTDRLEGFTTVADLSKPDYLQDFVWLRASANSPRKRPNRSTRGCEFGYEDLARFCEKASQVLEIPVRRLIRGHDHVPERYQAYPRYTDCPLLTINAMCRRLEDEIFGPQFPKGCVARHVPGSLPEIHQLPIREDSVRAVYFPSSIPSAS